jgi:four helix bundle protein
VHSRYKDLDAFRRAAVLADEIHRHVRIWPQLDQRSLGAQLTRAADSVGANIAESSGRWSKAERRRFLINARGSLYEVEYWSDRAIARSLPLPEMAGRLDAIARPLSGLIRKHSS